MELAQVRAQLEYLLSHPLFRNSKRYPAFLRYVDQSLLGNAHLLKERTVGIEVFGRELAYDSTADPIVRIAVGSLSKMKSVSTVINVYYKETSIQ
jgi:hypothetical protein